MGLCSPMGHGSRDKTRRCRATYPAFAEPWAGLGDALFICFGRTFYDRLDTATRSRGFWRTDSERICPPHYAFVFNGISLLADCGYLPGTRRFYRRVMIPARHFKAARSRGAPSPQRALFFAGPGGLYALSLSASHFSVRSNASTIGRGKTCSDLRPGREKQRCSPPWLCSCCGWGVYPPGDSFLRVRSRSSVDHLVKQGESRHPGRRVHASEPV